jgi:enterochelin esterase-like enzyme
VEQTIADRVAAFEKQWTDPVQEDQGLTRFRRYPQPSRAEPAAEGSYQLYLPPGYEAGRQRRYPVIYWLHGGFGDSRQGLPAVERIDEAIRSGAMPPVIVVLPQALPIGWYIDSKDGARPVEQVMVRDLVQHVDTAYRTIAAAAARYVEGFSMGGYGALHLGLKYPALFARVSAIGPSILRDMAGEPDERVANTFFGDQDYYDAVGPWTLLLGNAPELRKHSRVRLLAGTEDHRLAPTLRDFAGRMSALGVPHEFHEVTGAGHDIAAIIDGLGDKYFAFWRSTGA